MTQRGASLTDAQRAAKLAQLERDIAQRNAGYRARALKLLPHVCASCSREFEGRRMKELTVHHKDHNHNNNPPDGSNWELLCIYCHDHEHEKTIDAKYITAGSSRIEPRGPGLANPFEQLGAILRTDADGTAQEDGDDAQPSKTPPPTGQGGDAT